jgi:hypothetical protein
VSFQISDSAAFLQKGLLGYEEILALQKDPTQGCVAIQRSAKASWEAYMNFYQECQDLLDNSNTYSSETGYFGRPHPFWYGTFADCLTALV